MCIHACKFPSLVHCALFQISFFLLNNSLLVALSIIIIYLSNKSNKLDEGNKFRQEMIREETKLAVIRDKMVRDMEAQGVNPRYLSEMKNVDVGKMLRR